VKESAVVAVLIIANNIYVAMRAFAFGALLGLPCLYLLIYNGRMLGTLEGLVYNHGYFRDFNALILTHGVLELTAICISGGSGLLLAKAIIALGNRTPRAALGRLRRRLQTPRRCMAAAGSRWNHRGLCDPALFANCTLDRGGDLGGVFGGLFWHSRTR
jgi:uncharacterized membrane protein SpoIIM required for sporulation